MIKPKKPKPPAPKIISGKLKDFFTRLGTSGYYRSKTDGKLYIGVKQERGMVAIIGGLDYSTPKLVYKLFNPNSIKFYAI